MIVFLVEEQSMHVTLKGLLPKLFPSWVERDNWQCIPHEGKSDLEKSIPRKIRAWRTPGVQFVVLRDQDAADCIKVKQKLIDLCLNAGRPDTLIRIVCRELESWFLGDLNAVEQGLGLNGIAAYQNRKKFRNPDLLRNAAKELQRLTSMPGKVGPARSIAPYMNIETNSSQSFHVFINGLRMILEKDE